MSAKPKIYKCKVTIEYMALATCEKDAIELAEEAVRTDGVHGGVVAEPYRGVMADGWSLPCLLYHPAIIISGKEYAKEDEIELGAALELLKVSATVITKEQA